MMSRLSRPRLRGLAAFLITTTVVTGCNVITDSGTLAESVSRVSGDSQTVSVGSQRTAPLVILVRGRNGSPLVGAGVNWSILSGGGLLDSAILTTDANGNAHVIYTTSDTAGIATIRAVSGKGSFAFTVHKRADTVGTLSAFFGDGTASLTSAPVVLIAKAHDKFGNAIPSVVVNWSATLGTLDSALSTTDTAGRATTLLRLGTDPGKYVVTATSKFNATTFTITGVPHTP